MITSLYIQVDKGKDQKERGKKREREKKKNLVSIVQSIITQGGVSGYYDLFYVLDFRLDF